MEHFIGLDIGTSYVKAGLFEGDRLLASASAPVRLYIPQPGWAEQEPEDWWQAACRVLRQVMEAAKYPPVRAIGLSGQCPSHVLADKNGRSIGRAIIWRDQRAQAEADWLSQNVAPGQALKSLGVPGVSGATSQLARFLWLKNNRRQDWESAASVLQPKDYMALRLTGITATDRFSAYCVAHAESGAYDSDFYASIGIDADKLPRTLMPIDVVGEVTGSAAAETGLQPGTKVVIGTIDAYCDTLAGGIACPGRAVDVTGTSEIVSLRIDHPVMADGIYAGRLDDTFEFLCGPTQAGGETLRWLAKNFYMELGEKIDFSLLEAEAGSAPAGSDGVVFLPYLDGERTPLWDANARGVFFGLSFITRRRHFTRAVYEGVAYAVRHILELGEKAHGQPAEKIVVCGGGSRSSFWNQVKADVFQREVYPAEIAETGCLGAAILAGVGAQCFPDLNSAAQAMVRLKPAVQPNRAHHDTYEAGYQIFRGLYPALQPLTALPAASSPVRGKQS